MYMFIVSSMLTQIQTQFFIVVYKTLSNNKISSFAVIGRVPGRPVKVAFTVQITSMKITMGTVFHSMIEPVCSGVKHLKQDSKLPATVKHGNSHLFDQRVLSRQTLMNL